MEPSLSSIQEHSKAYLIIYIDKDDLIQVKVNMTNELHIRGIASKAIDVGDQLLGILGNEESVEREDEE